MRVSLSAQHRKKQRTPISGAAKGSALIYRRFLAAFGKKLKTNGSTAPQARSAAPPLASSGSRRKRILDLVPSDAVQAVVKDDVSVVAKRMNCIKKSQLSIGTASWRVFSPTFFPNTLSTDSLSTQN